MTSDTGLTDLDLVDAAAGIEAGTLDPVELTEAYLARIAATEPELNAYVTVDADGARSAAHAARDEIDSGRYRGPLHGIPIGIKDIFDTAGVRTTYGSIRYTDHVPTSDAVVVARARHAGAVILGKQATHEFAWGGRTDNPHFGPTHNPWDPSRIPGGSSGGGAASIIARSSLLAIGSDTAGSVRIPAAMCGCVGFKPERGWIDMAGAFPLAPDLDHVGILARSVRDVTVAATALGGLVDHRGRPHRDGDRRLSVAVLTEPSADLLDEAVRFGVARAAAALRDSGALVTEVPIMRVDERALAVLTLIKAAAEAVHRSSFQADPSCYGADLADLLSGPEVSADQLGEAEREVARAVADLDAVCGAYDVVLSATVPVVAPAIGSMTVVLGDRPWPIEPILTRLTSIANAGGWPAISVPANADSDWQTTAELPTGVQLLCAPDNVQDLMVAADIVTGGKSIRPWCTNIQTAARERP